MQHKDIYTIRVDLLLQINMAGLHDLWVSIGKEINVSSRAKRKLETLLYQSTTQFLTYMPYLFFDFF